MEQINNVCFSLLIPVLLESVIVYNICWKSICIFTKQYMYVKVIGYSLRSIKMQKKRPISMISSTLVLKCS